MTILQNMRRHKHRHNRVFTGSKQTALNGPAEEHLDSVDRACQVSGEVRRMSEKVEYTACHFLDGKILGSRTRFLADEGTSGKPHRITREGDIVTIEELVVPFRIYELPRAACILERKAAEKGKGK